MLFVGAFASQALPHSRVGWSDGGSAPSRRAERQMSNCMVALALYREEMTGEPHVHADAVRASNDGTPFRP